MSGGEYDYMHDSILKMYRDELEFPILEELLVDFCKILKSLDWYKSGDTGRERYLQDVKHFLDKWIREDVLHKTEEQSNA